MVDPRIIVIEAESLEEARQQVKSQIPEGLFLLSEKVISDGKPKTVKAVADTKETAFAKAQSQMPIDANVLEKKEVTAPEQKAITVEAFDEQSAKAQVQAKIGDTLIIKDLRLTATGKKGFLGIGKTPNQYEADVFQQAVVAITYKTKAKISANVGEKKTTENCYLCGRTISEREMTKSITGGFLLGDILGGNAKYMPNVLEGLAMKCNRCDAWVCIDCAQKAALSQGAGMLKHSSCGGMFETPS